MSNEIGRGGRASLAVLFAALVPACVTPGDGAGPSAAAAPRGAPDRAIMPPEAERRGTARPTSCPIPPGANVHSELGRLDLFSRTLFYVRENHPADISPRSRDLLVKA